MFAILIGKFDQLGSSAVRFNVLNNGSGNTPIRINVLTTGSSAYDK